MTGVHGPPWLTAPFSGRFVSVLSRAASGKTQGAGERGTGKLSKQGSAKLREHRAAGGMQRVGPLGRQERVGGADPPPTLGVDQCRVTQAALATRSSATVTVASTALPTRRAWAKPSPERTSRIAAPTKLTMAPMPAIVAIVPKA